MRRLLIGAAVLAGVVTILGVLVRLEVPALLDLDRSVGAAVRYGGRGSVEVGVLQVLTAPGLTVFRIVVLIPVAIALAIRRQWPIVGFILVPTAAVGPITVLLKYVVGRVRPTAEDPLVSAGGLSFPSGHSSGAATLAGVLLVVLWPVVSRRWRPWMVGALIALAVCVAWTRIALGVHYLSDTIGGLALGSAVVLVSMIAFGIYPGGRAELPERGWAVAGSREP